jgi:hypothetical protein
MITVNKKEQVCRAHCIEDISFHQPQRETGNHRQTIPKALEDSEVPLRPTEATLQPPPGTCQADHRPMAP